MAIGKPYFRIYRPIKNSNHPDYLEDFRFSSDRFNYIHAYGIIQSDLKNIFDFIAPHDDSLSIYSYRIYELLLRASTEFETNCKAILYANGYSNGILNIKDYFKINKATKLNEYQVFINIWLPKPLTVSPFESWDSESFKPLPWYQEYNKVKHDRGNDFKYANLKNLILSVSGLLVILYSQYSFLSFDPFQPQSLTDTITGNESTMGSLFSIKSPVWTDDEKYMFSWNDLKQEPMPFEKYSF